jgi:uncharacterized damage-inducible protein DinB
MKRRELINMTEQLSPLITFYKQGWKHHHQALVKTIASLSCEQLALPIAPQQRSLGDLLDHLLGARFNWFYLWMGEGDIDCDWNDENNENNEGPTIYEATAMTSMFEKSWNVIASCLDRWTPADLEQLFSPPASHQAWLQKQGLPAETAHTRQWIIWHVMEHEIHHGGEFSLGLGTHGVASFYTW